MEAELDIQMAKIESKAKEKARMEYDSEKRELKTKMETELAELQAQLKLFQSSIRRLPLSSCRRQRRKLQTMKTWRASASTRHSLSLHLKNILNSLFALR